MMPVYRYDTKPHVKIAILLGIVFAMAVLVLMMLPDHRISSRTCQLDGMAGCEAPIIVPVAPPLAVSPTGAHHF